MNRLFAFLFLACAATEVQPQDIANKVATDNSEFSSSLHGLRQVARLLVDGNETHDEDDHHNETPVDDHDDHDDVDDHDHDMHNETEVHDPCDEDEDHAGKFSGSVLVF